MARKYGAVKSADVQGWIVGSHCQRRTATRRARRLLDGARVSRGPGTGGHCLLGLGSRYSTGAGCLGLILRCCELNLSITKLTGR